MAFNAPVLFGETQGTVDFISGHYIRAGEYESAELKIQRRADGRYHVTGNALYGTHREYGPNIGELDFIGELAGDTIEYRWSYPSENKKYRALLQFSEDGLAVIEENWVGIFGMNVNFTGHYDKATNC